MFIQTVIQHLLGKRKKKVRVAETATERELSPLAQSIMQKLSEHEKINNPAPKSVDCQEKSSATSDY
jgi:hypothetical protein